MTNASLLVDVSAKAGVHPLIERLIDACGYPALDETSLDYFTAQATDTLLFFAEEPARYRETLDLAVILPELDKAFAGRFKVGVLLPLAARALQPRFGFNRWPALVVMRGGEYVGAIAGLRDWAVYCQELHALLQARTQRPPTVGIAVTGTPQASNSNC